MDYKESTKNLVFSSDTELDSSPYFNFNYKVNLLYYKR